MTSDETKAREIACGATKHGCYQGSLDHSSDCRELQHIILSALTEARREGLEKAAKFLEGIARYSSSRNQTKVLTEAVGDIRALAAREEKGAEEPSPPPAES